MCTINMGLIIDTLDSSQTHLPTASAVVLPAYDGERSFAGDARVAGFIRHPIWRIYREPTTQLTPPGPVIRQHSVCFKENEPVILTLLWEGWSDLRTAPPGPWLPPLMKKWPPDRGRSPPALHCARQDLLNTRETP